MRVGTCDPELLGKCKHGFLSESSLDGADDNDPPCATSADTVCDVETAGETGTLGCSAHLTCFMFGSASDTERDIISCASPTRALSASEDMAWMSCVLHCSVWSRDCRWVIAASQPMHPEVCPYSAAPLNF